MMRWTLAPLLLGTLLLATACGHTAAPAVPTPAPAVTLAPAPAAPPTSTPKPTPAPGTLQTAVPQPAAEQYAGVKLAGRVTPEMLQPDYWLQGDDTADLIRRTPAEIAAFNAATLAALAPVDRMFDLAAQGDTLPGERVRALLAADPAAPAGDRVNGAAMPADYLQTLEARRNQAAIPETVPLRYGVMADRANARTQPTEDRFSRGGDAFFDDVQQAELYWNEPVLILHESDDGAWYYVLSSRMDGWVKQEKVALFDTRAAWEAWQAQPDFLVVTANRLRLDYNTEHPELSEREISMGTRLPLAVPEEIPPSVAGRLPVGNYIAKLPLRAADGAVTFAYAPVPVSADVSRGLLPYTRRNLLHQLFKVQGTNYGWGGTQAANDCSGITVQLYRCFGFELPRNSKSLSMLPCATRDLPGLNPVERAEAFRPAPPGSILYFPGHIMLYLGERDGNYYVMSAVGAVDLYGRGRPDRVLTVLINDLNVRRDDGMTWFAQMKTIKMPEGD